MLPEPPPDLRPASSSQGLLNAALQQQQQHVRRLNRISIITAVVLAVVISVMAANQNVYSLLATFGVSLMLLILASIYQRSLWWLVPLAAGFCLADNLLSYHWQFNREHFLLQLAALGSFIVLFRLSRPYLLGLMQKS